MTRFDFAFVIVPVVRFFIVVGVVAHRLVYVLYN